MPRDSGEPEPPQPTSDARRAPLQSGCHRAPPGAQEIPSRLVALNHPRAAEIGLGDDTSLSQVIGPDIHTVRTAVPGQKLDLPLDGRRALRAVAP